MMSYKKAALLSILLGVISVGVWFHQPLLSKIIEYSLQKHFRQNYQAEFHVEQIYRDGKNWIFEKPTLKRFDSWKEEVTAERVLVSYEGLIQAFQRDFYIVIEEGSIAFTDPTHPVHKKQAYFELEAFTGGDPQLNASVWMKQPYSLDNWVEITLLQTNSELTVPITIHALDCDQINPFRHLISPFAKQWQASRGVLDGTVELTFDSTNRIKQTGELVVHNLLIENSTLGLTGSLPEASIHLSDITTLALLQPASCAIKNPGQSPWEFGELQGEFTWPLSPSTPLKLSAVCKHNGEQFPLSLASQATDEESDKQLLTFIGEYGALQAVVDLDLSSNDTLATLRARGLGSQLVSVIPTYLQTRLRDKIGEERLYIEAILSKTLFGGQINGILRFSKAGLADEDTIVFGMDIATTSSLENLLGYTLKSGWLQADQLPLDKYVAPLIFNNDQMQLNGWGNVQGAFDSKTLVLHYDARELFVSNPYFTLDCACLAEDLDSPWPAVHYFDFITGSHGGVIPLKHTRYFEKSSGLLFTDIAAQVTLGQNGVYATDVETFCNGIYFAGDLNINYGSLPGRNLDVGIYAHTMSGRISDVQSLVAHFNPDLINRSPLEGNVSLHKQGGYIQIFIDPQSIQTEAYVQGVISEGAIKFQNADIALHDLSADFEYDYQLNALGFSDIQGTMLVGPPDHVEEYAFAGDHIHFTDYTQYQAEFDVWVGDKNRDILRVVGKTQPLEDPSQVELQLDHHLSHFGNVHPDLFRVVLKNGVEVEKLDVQFGFQLSSLLRDLQRFSRTGLLLLSRGLLKELNDLKTAEGDFRVDVQYDQPSSLLTYHVTSQDCNVGKYAFNQCLLKGRKKGNTWTIDQLQLDELSFAAEVTEKDNLWDVNFLGLRYGKSLLLGLSGKYNPVDTLFKGHVNLLEIQLEHLNEWKKLVAFADQWNPKGELRGTGPLKIEFGKGKSGLHLETSLNATLQQGEIQGIPFQEIKNFSCDFTSDRGLTIRGMKTALIDPISQDTRADLDLKKFEYSAINHDFILEDLRFNIPAKQLQWVVSQIQDRFPILTNTDVAHVIKSENSVEGAFHFSSQSQVAQVTFPAGKYQFNGNEYDIDQFAITLNPFEANVLVQCKHSGTPYCLSLWSKFPALASGELFISTATPDLLENQKKIIIKWSKDPISGFTIEQVDGQCAGITASLYAANESKIDQICLEGDLTIDPTRILFLPSAFQKKIVEWKLRGDYLLSGTWKLPKESLMTGQGLQFSGALQSKNCTINDYQIENLSAHVEGSSKGIQIKDVRLHDAAGTLSARVVDLSFKDEEGCFFKIPLINISEGRPSLLRTTQGPNIPSDSTLVIRQLNLENFGGNLFDPNTFQGEGRAYFINPPKREIPGSGQTVPAGILAGAGLDLSVLSPVAGTILYRIADQKIYLTKFKEMYSAGRLSKFYLPKKTATPSYIDFDGNLFVQVRMKQSSLLFKLAELFTVTIQGTWQEPTYAILKQSE